jgi:amino acid permease
LADNAQKNVSAVIYRSVGAALFIYESIGILGYLSFGDDVLPNIILMYNNGTVVTAGRAAIVILQLFSFPLQCHPCRASLDKVWAGKSISHTLVPTSEEEANARAHHDSTNLQGLEEQVTVTEDSEFDEPAVNVPPPAPILTTDQRFFLLTSGILIASYILAISIQELDLVLSLVGSTGSTTISFILPGIFYWKLTEPAPGRRDYRRSLKQRVLRWSAGALAVYGVCIMIICLTFNLQRAFSSP